jgi:hypothetical protein
MPTHTVTQMPSGTPTPAYTFRPSPTLLLFTPPVDIVWLSDGTQLLSREHYRPYDFDNDPWLQSFATLYREAIQQNEIWVENPITVALRFSGFYTPDCGGPDRLIVFYENDSSVVVVIGRDHIRFDDSVAGIEDRIDLVRQGAVWEFEWVGGRFRCQPGRGQQDWGPDLCV